MNVTEIHYAHLTFSFILRIVWCSFALSSGLSVDLETKQQMKDEVNVSSINSFIAVESLVAFFQRLYRTLTSNAHSRVDSEDLENGRVDSNRLKLFLEN